MSAWSTAGRHDAIVADAIVAYGLHHGQGVESVYLMLATENANSLHYRYRDADEMIGPDVPYAPGGEVTAAELHGLVRSYRYQSCEHPSWEGCWVDNTTAVLLLEIEFAHGVPTETHAWSVADIGRTAREAEESAAREAKAKATQSDTVRVGSFFVHTWGYDQTNVDYYRVVGMTKSGKTVKLQQVRTECLSDNGATARVVPTDEPMTRRMRRGIALDPTGDEWVTVEAEIISKRLQFSGSQPFVRMDHGWCKLWDGAPDAATSRHAGR